MPRDKEADSPWLPRGFDPGSVLSTFCSVLTRPSKECVIVLALLGSAWPIVLEEEIEVHRHVPSDPMF